MKFKINHTTVYEYEGPVRESINQIRLKPLENTQQKLISHTIRLSPSSKLYSFDDFWGNCVQTFYVWEPHKTLTIESLSELELTFPPLKEENIEKQIRKEEWESQKFLDRFAEYLTYSPYTKISEDELEKYTAPIWRASKTRFEYLKNIMSYLYREYAYQKGTTGVETTAEEFLHSKTGVCQDFTHLMLAFCRFREIPARYISGYIYCGEDSAMRGDAATHAWVEVMLPGFGWLGFDPTNNMLAFNQHIRAAAGRDYKDIVPVKGTYRGGKQHMEVRVSVSKLGG